MKKFFILATVMLIIGGLVFILGCSDDDDTGTGSTGKAAGDTLNPVFIGATDALSDAMDSIPIGMFSMMNALEYLIDSTPPVIANGDKQPDTIWYDAGSHYWYAEESYSDMMNFYRIDSMQFMHGGTAVQWPDSALVTAVNGGTYEVVRFNVMDKSLAGDTAFRYGFHGTISGAAGEVAGMGNVTVAGSGNMYLNRMILKDAADISCGYELNDNFSIENIQMNLYTVFGLEGCPMGGSLVHHAGITLTCTGDTAFSNTDNWYLQESFANDSSHYVVENSTYRWEMTESCAGDGK
jgi:hypothetical protein